MMDQLNNLGFDHAENSRNAMTGDSLGCKSEEK